MKNTGFYYVKEVAKEKSFSKASKKLGISQPALSSYINKLEKNKGNSEIVDKLTNFIKAEQNERNKYKVSVEYDDETGLVKDIVMEIAEE